MSRKPRSINRKYKVFCEGDTEFNYFEYIRKNKLITLKLSPVNMSGGGYNSFLMEIKKDSNTDCLAKFIVIDGDRAYASVEEKKAFKELIKYCFVQNESKRTPHILIIDSPNFEYSACLHCGDYKGSNADNFIKKYLKYKSIDEFKADENVYCKLNSGNNTYKNLINSRRNTVHIVDNEILINKKEYNITVESVFREENIGKKGTNLQDFFMVTENL